MCKTSSKVAIFEGITYVYIGGNFSAVSLQIWLRLNQMTSTSAVAHDIRRCMGMYRRLSQSSHATIMGYDAVCGNFCHVQLQ